MRCWATSIGQKNRIDAISATMAAQQVTQRAEKNEFERDNNKADVGSSYLDSAVALED